MLAMKYSWLKFALLKYGGARSPAPNARLARGKSARFGTAMLFSDRLSEQEMLEAKGARRQDLLDILLNDFRKAFPDLEFEPQLDFSIINAQAFTLGDKRIVAIFGGLALHPKLGAEALTFITLHGRTSSCPGLPFGTRPVSRMRMRIGLLGCNGRSQ